jgi:hypothetical protein
MGEKQINVLTEEMVEKKLKDFAERMIKAQPREYMTFQEFREKVADWSESTLKRRIKEEGFPAIRDGGGYLIPRKKLEAWFNAREVKP